MSYANNKGADQPAHPRSLISVFVVPCLDIIMSLVSVTKMSSLMLAFVAAQANLSLTWSETPKDTFSHNKAHINDENSVMLNEREVTYRHKKTTTPYTFLYEPRQEKTCLREFLTRPDSNRPAQPQKLARVLKFRP